MPNALRKLRETKGMSQDALATAMGTTRSQYVKLERGERRLSQGWIERAAAALGVPPAAILGETQTVPLVGLIGAGGAVHALDDHEKGAGFDDVEAPPGASRSTVAAEVRGDSMPAVAEDGWLVYWEARGDPPSNRHVG